MKGLSLFSGAGIGETYFKECGVDIIVANEIIKKRAELYKRIYPTANMIQGDISEEKIFNEIMETAKNVDFIIASPPCQGMSVAGKNRCLNSMQSDQRNYLIEYVIKAIKQLKPKYVLIENVPLLFKLKIMYDSKPQTILEILQEEFQTQYIIENRVMDAADYGVPQTRLRAIVKMNLKGTEWEWPQKSSKKITVHDAIGKLPSLEAGEKSKIKWHYSRNHDQRHILWMKNTPTGKSAFSNEIHYPQKRDGKRITGYESSYRRIKWDEPSPTITIRNDAISSQRNVHPGKLQEDGTYSDARVLTPLELMYLTSLPENWNIPEDTPEILIRQCIGESIPPLMLKKIIEGIK